MFRNIFKRSPDKVYTVVDEDDVNGTSTTIEEVAFFDNSGILRKDATYSVALCKELLKKKDKNSMLCHIRDLTVNGVYVGNFRVLIEKAN